VNLTEEQILALAPDESSKKAGKDLAGAAKWVTKGINEKALWGECQGSGSKPYQTQIDLNTTSFKCSCPSRKFPCKHGLGLLLYNVRKPADFTVSQMPAWVEEWIAKRTEKVEKAAEKREAPVDEAAQAKRQQARENKVAAGIEELLFWIKDIVRNGILIMPEKGTAFFDGMARRMVDAQAPGLAAMIRNLGNTPFYKEGWQQDFLDGIIRIYLIASGYKNLPSVNTALQQDVKAAIGFTQSAEDLKDENGVSDNWLVLGKQTTEEDNITVERNWLYGIGSKQYALILQFIIRGQAPQTLITPGTCLQAELVFYPSAAPLRAIIKQQTGTIAPPKTGGFSGWQQVTESQAAIYSLHPFGNERPYIVEQLTPVLQNGRWHLQDANTESMPISEKFSNIWKLLAVSGGEPLYMAIVGREKSYEPLGVWHNEMYKLL
jgi:uncharacterized Zn finger protein